MDQLKDKGNVENHYDSDYSKLQTSLSSESYGLGLIQDYSSSSEDETSVLKDNHFSAFEISKKDDTHLPTHLITNINPDFKNPLSSSNSEQLNLQTKDASVSLGIDIPLSHNKEFDGNGEVASLPHFLQSCSSLPSVDSIDQLNQPMQENIDGNFASKETWLNDGEDKDSQEILILGPYRTLTTGSEGNLSDTDSDLCLPDVVADDRPLPPPKTKGELDLKDLPPIENLHISIPETSCIYMGKVASIVSELVVVQSDKNLPALDIDTVLFLDKGKTSLGKVFDVMGQVSEPLYAIRFNTSEEIAEKSIIVGMPVYYAPSTGFTSFVFFEQLRRLKGSDASWLDNNEPPDQYLEYSDDEQERKAKQAFRAKREGSAKASNTVVTKPKKKKPVQSQSHYYSQQQTPGMHANISWHNSINNRNFYNNNSSPSILNNISAFNYYCHQNSAPSNSFPGSAPPEYYSYPNTSWNTNHPYFQYPFQQPYPPMFGCPPYPQLTDPSQQANLAGTAAEAHQNPNMETSEIQHEGDVHDNKPG